VKSFQGPGAPQILRGKKPSRIFPAWDSARCASRPFGTGPPSSFRWWGFFSNLFNSNWAKYPVRIWDRLGFDKQRSKQHVKEESSEQDMPTWEELDEDLKEYLREYWGPGDYIPYALQLDPKKSPAQVDILNSKLRDVEKCYKRPSTISYLE
jgi:hypothetical protein